MISSATHTNNHSSPIARTSYAVYRFADAHERRYSRRAKALLASYDLSPPPTIIEVDQRTDSEVTIPLLKRLTGAEQLPVAIIGGNPIRSIQEFRALVKSGALNDMVAASGAKINGKKVKHGRKH